jgi:hypothetical protein
MSCGQFQGAVRLDRLAAATLAETVGNHDQSVL